MISMDSRVRTATRCFREIWKRDRSSAASQGLFAETLEFSSPHTASEVSDVKEDTTVVLHGLLGTGRNLRTFVNMLFNTAVAQAGEPQKHKVLLMDLRHHGHTNAMYTPKTSDTLENAAQDVLNTLHMHNLGSESSLRIIGHSLGGKVALAAAGISQLPCQVWTLDSFPFSFDETSKRNALGVLKVLETIEGIVQPLETREELYEILDSHGFEKNIQQWLGSNLIGDRDSGYVWNFHIPGVFNLYRDYSKTDYSDLLHDTGKHSIGVVRALLSRGWDQESIEKLEKVSQADNSTAVYELDNAGHWLHAQNPKGLVDLMLSSNKFITSHNT
jgi:pimeloyl-ACP methyl ester carboxylesterase